MKSTLLIVATDRGLKYEMPLRGFVNGHFYLDDNNTSERGWRLHDPSGFLGEVEIRAHFEVKTKFASFRQAIQTASIVRRRRFLAAKNRKKKQQRK